MELGWTSFLFMGIALVLLVRISKYLRNELRIVPQNTFWQKFKVNLSIFMFSVILTATILFIAGIISSAIASNASIALSGNIDEDLVSSFTWPTLLPLTLMGLSVYVSIYPLIEILYMGKGSQDGAMEIQKWIENNIVDRFRVPFSYIIAFTLWAVIFIVPPSIISYVLLYKLEILSAPGINMSAVTLVMIVFLDWFMIMPLLYLTYYATIGCSQAWFAGLKANLRKNKTRLVYFIFAIFTFLSTISNLIIYIPILIHPSLLEPAVPGETTGLGGFIQQLIEFLMRLDPNVTPEDWMRWYEFVQIVPLDFLLFFVVTCVFSILGFYAKFLNKEPLNRPILVFFAAYIVCGIAFQVFANIITKWPWAFPSQNLWVDLTQYNTDPTVKLIMQLFIIAVVSEKVFTGSFLIYQLFFNKTLKETINETVLTQAIADQDIEVLKRYTKDKNPRIRKMVAEAVMHIIESNPLQEDSEKLIPIFEDLIVDRDPDVIKTIVPAIKISSFKIPIEKLYFTIQIGLGTEEDTNINEIQKLIIDIGKIHPEQIQGLYETLYSGYVPDKVKGALMQVLQILGQKYPELSYNISIPMLDRKNLQIKKSSLWIIKNLIHDFRPKYNFIYEKMRDIALNKNDPLRIYAIEIMGYIASADQSFNDKFIEDIEKIDHQNVECVEKIIGGLTQIVISNPNKLDLILKLISQYLFEEKSALRADSIMSLGVIGIQLDQNDFLAKIYPNFVKITNMKDLNSKKHLINTFKFLFKAREDFLLLEPSMDLIIQFILDDSQEIRSEIFSMIKNYDEMIAINIFLRSLKNSNTPEKTVNILSNFNELLSENIIKTISNDEELLDRIHISLLSQNFDNNEIRNISVGILCKIADYSKTLTEKIYPTLASILRGKNVEAAAIVLKFFGKLAMMKKIDNSLNNIDLQYDNFYKEIQQWLAPADSKKIKDNKEDARRIAAVECLEQLYEADSSKFEEIYNTFYKLRNDPNVKIRATVIKMISIIACDFQDIFFKFYEKERESEFAKVAEQSRLEVEILPVIFQNFSSKDSEIQKAIIESLSIITDVYGKSSIIKDFLFRSLKKRPEIETKVNIIACLSRLKNAEMEADVVNRLKSLTYDQDPIVRETALRCLCSLFMKFEKSSSQDDKKDKEKIKSFKRLQNAILKRRFFRDHDKLIKLAFIDEVSDIAIKFPDLVEPMLLIKEYYSDESQEVAINAVKSFFKYISIYPKKLEKIAGYMRLFANSSDIAVKNILLREIIDHYRSGDDLKYYLPTLLKLAVDKDTTIRKKSLTVFKEIYEKTTEKLLYFMELLIRLTRDRDPRIRTDSCDLVAQLTFEFPKNIRQQSLVFDTFSRLSRDFDISVKRTVSRYLENLIKIFPERINQVLQMTYTLMREKDRDVIQRCVVALKYVIFLYPDKINEIKPIIIRFYRRSANPYIESLLREIESIKTI